MIKLSQSSQNSNFAMSLQYLQKEVKVEVHFLHADKLKISYKLVSTVSASKLLQGDSVIIGGCDQAFSKYSK